MPQTSVAHVFEGMTAKQHEAMTLAASGYTSKEIARELEISPHSVDKRIDAVRIQLDGVPRNQLVREYIGWKSTGDSITGDPFPLTGHRHDPAQMAPQPEGETLLFSDAMTFHGSREWGRADRLHRGIKPADVSTGWRVLLVLFGAFFFAAAFVLVAAAGNVLIDLLG